MIDCYRACFCQARLFWADSTRNDCAFFSYTPADATRCGGQALCLLLTSVTRVDVAPGSTAGAASGSSRNDYDGAPRAAGLSPTRPLITAAAAPHGRGQREQQPHWHLPVAHPYLSASTKPHLPRPAVQVGMNMDPRGEWIDANESMLLTPSTCNYKGARRRYREQCGPLAHHRRLRLRAALLMPGLRPCCRPAPAADQFSCQEECLLSPACVAWMFGVDDDSNCPTDADGAVPPYDPTATPPTGCPGKPRLRQRGVEQPERGCARKHCMLFSGFYSVLDYNAAGRMYPGAVGGCRWWWVAGKTVTARLAHHLYLSPRRITCRRHRRTACTSRASPPALCDVQAMWRAWCRGGPTPAQASTRGRRRTWPAWYLATCTRGRLARAPACCGPSVRRPGRGGCGGCAANEGGKACGGPQGPPEGRAGGGAASRASRASAHLLRCLCSAQARVCRCRRWPGTWTPWWAAGAATRGATAGTTSPATSLSTAVSPLPPLLAPAPPPWDGRRGALRPRCRRARRDTHASPSRARAVAACSELCYAVNQKAAGLAAAVKAGSDWDEAALGALPLCAFYRWTESAISCEGAGQKQVRQGGRGAGRVHWGDGQAAQGQCGRAEGDAKGACAAQWLRCLPPLVPLAPLTSTSTCAHPPAGRVRDGQQTVSGARPCGGG